MARFLVHKDPQYADGVELRPDLDRAFQTSIPGLHVVGAANGSPLLKTCINEGVEVVRCISRLMKPGGPSAGGRSAGGPSAGGRGAGGRSDGEAVDLIIVGAGPTGLAAAHEARRRGFSAAVLEQGRPLNTILNFPEGKVIYAEPQQLRTFGDLEFVDTTKEELLATWQRLVEGADIHSPCNVADVRRRDGLLEVVTEEGRTFLGRRVILAVGRMGNPRCLGIPGEDGPGIYSSLLNPGKYRDKSLVVVGGGNSAAEAALALAQHNRVTLVYRGEALTRPSRVNRERIAEQEGRGKLTVLMKAKPAEFRPGEIIVEVAGERRSLRRDMAFVLIGADPPVGFLRRLGVRMEGQFSWSKALQFAWVFALVWAVYGVKFGQWPFAGTYRALHAAQIDPGLLYGVLYTALLTVFGIRALHKYRDDPYQVKRYRTLIAAQWLIYFILPWALFYAGHSEWWRSWGVSLTYPLGYYALWEPAETLFSGTSLGWAVAAAVGFLVVMPLASIRHGKRFCAWICPCGGMADTAGDFFRHKAPRGKGIRYLESGQTVILAATLILSFYFIYGYRVFGAGAADGLHAGYKLIVDFGFASMAAIALYPFSGNRIWCRFGCPLAKWMELWGRWSGGRLAIVPNDECISCGECTKYCQMGIDVRAFAERETALSNRTTECIFCGICVTVCPVDVLRVEYRDGKQLARIEG